MAADHYAILVAINDYPGLSDLAGPENDAEEFRSWLVDPAGGAVGSERVALLRSSDFPPAADPDDANPTETQFKKTLNRWLRNGEEWRDRVGERLYLFFAGHGFTSGSLEDPALFTAQARFGDTAHIAAARYAARIRYAGFFDEIVLIMDCCQDVLKASPLSDPTWSPPDRRRSGQVKLMSAFGAPRGEKAYETRSGGPARGYFSKVFLEALKTAPEDDDGNVTARAVEQTFYDLWDRTYRRDTGYEPPIIAPYGLNLYSRPRVPKETDDFAQTYDFMSPQGPSAAPMGEFAVSWPLAAPEPREPPTARVTLTAKDAAAHIRVFDNDRRVTAEGAGSLETRLAPGRYTARFALADAVNDQAFFVPSDGTAIEITQPPLSFSSPVPLSDTATHREYHYYPAMDLRQSAAARRGAASLVVFARDSAHAEGETWAMTDEARIGLRLRRLDPETGIPFDVRCEVEVDESRGFSSLCPEGLAAGSYLLGVLRRLPQGRFWQEQAITLPPYPWRTEVYLDCVEDDRTGRRYDPESAAVLVVAETGGATGYGPRDRLTEIARLSIRTGRPITGILADEDSIGLEPMLALYAAYELALAPATDPDRLRSLCGRLRTVWTVKSADARLLERRCDILERKRDRNDPIDFDPDEAPMLAAWWKLAPKIGKSGLLHPSAQRTIGAWRTTGSLWTVTLVPDAPPRAAQKLPLPRLRDGAVDYAAVCASLAPLDYRLSPLQQAIRRVLVDAREAGEVEAVKPRLAGIGSASGVGARVLADALAELVR